MASRGAQKPVLRHSSVVASPGVVDLSCYTERKCHHFTMNMAMAELVQNWKDEVDAAADRCLYRRDHVQMSKVTFRDATGRPWTKYEMFLPPLARKEALASPHGLDWRRPISLGSLEIEEAELSTVYLTNLSDRMHVEMLYDGWSGPEKLEGWWVALAGFGLREFFNGRKSHACMFLHAKDSAEENLEMACSPAYAHYLAKLAFASAYTPADVGGSFLGGIQIRTVRQATRNACLLRFLVGLSSGLSLTICPSTCAMTLVQGFPRGDFDEAQFLFLCPPSARISNHLGDILLDKTFAGSIYVKDMRVLKSGRPACKHGLNLRS